ncbi:helix-turn-helix domain-containing protein [Enterocloster bolteae]|uniref:helix-turn-helix domain-containing protein n=1 Tax=Enterocloster bolteae TaxID=208479 RepID=UPI001FABE528|nr:helix-turn-helix transcriptional regulator [Enterocloster bolteae]
MTGFNPSMLNSGFYSLVGAEPLFLSQTRLLLEYKTIVCHLQAKVKRCFMFFFFYPPSFAKRLNELRVSKNLTMEQLSKDLSTTRGTISNFENEQRKPSLDMVIKIADYFQVSIDYLVGRTNDPTFHRTKKD